MMSRAPDGRTAEAPILWLRYPDGGSYVGGVSRDLAQGHAVAVGPRNVGEYAGLYQAGYETLGVLKSVSAESNGQAKTSSTVNSYSGEWSDGYRHGLGVDARDTWIFRGEWTQGFRGRYGVRQKADTTIGYAGTWTSGVPDGFGVETYGDGSTYCGQWMKGMRHGYGVRQSSAYQVAAKYRQFDPITPLQTTQSRRSTLLQNPADSLVTLRDQRLLISRGGFVLLADTSFPALPRKHGLLIDRHGRPSLSKTISHQLKMRGMSPGGFSRSSSVRSVSSRKSGGSVKSAMVQGDFNDYIDEDTVSFISQDFTAVNPKSGTMREVYRGEWKDDRRNGYGVCERTDGLRYEGEWLNNQKHGYGCTIMPDGTRVNGKYRNNVLITSANTKTVLSPFVGNKILDRVSFAIEESQKAAKFAQEKEEIAKTRMKGARERALLADAAAGRALREAEAARAQAVKFMSNTKSSSDAPLSMHRPSERDFYLEVDPSDKDFSIPGSQSIKKKRFGLSLRSRAGSLSSDDQKSELKNFVSNQPSRSSAAPRSNFDSTKMNVTDPTMEMFYAQRSQLQGSSPLNVPLSAPVQPPTYRFEASDHIPPLNRLSSVPPEDYHEYRDYAPDYLPSEAGRTRRKSLPSIVKEKVMEEVPSLYDDRIDPDIPSRSKLASLTDSAYDAKQRIKRVDTYIIENGQRKLVRNTRESPIDKVQRGDSQLYDSEVKPAGALSQLIKSSFNAASAAPRTRVGAAEQFKDLYKAEKPESTWKRSKGSTPDITALLDVRVPPREEVYVLSQRRREELIQERADRENSRIVLSFFDIKRWLTRNILLVFFIFINIFVALVLMKS